MIDIDLNGTFLTSLTCFPHLKKSKGVIINLSATLHMGATDFQVHASAAKAGIDAITRNLALEWGAAYGIRCLSKIFNPNLRISVFIL